MVFCVCVLCVLSVCVFCVCVLCVFSVCVFCVCFLCVFSVCVFCVCFLRVFSVCVFCVCCAAVLSDSHRWRKSSQPNQHLCMTPPLHNPVHLVLVVNHPSTSLYCTILCLFGRGISLCFLVSILLCCVWVRPTCVENYIFEFPSLLTF